MSNQRLYTLAEIRNGTGFPSGARFQLVEPPKSYKPEVIADSSGKWCGNALRFATYAEAEANAQDLASRWTLVREWRVSPSDDPPNYRWDPELGLCRLPETNSP